MDPHLSPVLLGVYPLLFPSFFSYPVRITFNLFGAFFALLAMNMREKDTTWEFVRVYPLWLGPTLTPRG